MKLKRTNNPARLVMSYILHLLDVLLDWFIGILLHNYDSNKALINKIDKFNDWVYKIEWHLKFNKKNQ